MDAPLDDRLPSAEADNGFAHDTVESEYADVVPTRRRPEAGAAGGWLPVALRTLGALSLLATGAVHLDQFIRLYSAIPTIGTLFVLNFAGATAIGLALLAPLESAVPKRGGLLVIALALAGITIAATAFAFLLISEQTPLFGFQEPGYDPPAITAVQAAEIATVVLLGAFVITRARSKAPRRAW